MQKINIEFSKHTTNGFILDFLIKSLEVFQKDDTKTYQRFIKEDEISAQEYHDTQDTIISDILFTFFDSFKNKDYEYYEKLINEFFKFYNLYKLNNETLATSQKQLDFITIINVFIPFINHLFFDRLLKYKIELSLIDSILPDEKENTIQKLFKLLESTFEDKTNLKDAIYKILDDNDKNYNLVKEDYDNWINGKNIPNMTHLNILSELAKFSNKFSENELKILFIFAKLIQYLYSKSKEYFGLELTSSIIKHYKIISMISFLQVSNKLDMFVNSFEINQIEQIKLYLEQYFYQSMDLFYMLDYFVKNNDYLNKTEDMKKYIHENRNKFDILYKIDEKNFFNKIENILQITYFYRNSVVCDSSNITIQDIDKNFYEFSQESSKLYTYVEPTNKKNEKSETNFLEVLKKLENKYNLEEDPYSLFLKARYHAQKREYKESTEYYLKALKYGKNTVGINIKDIIKEGLFVSAQNTRNEQIDLDKASSPFRKFYNEAYFYKLLESLPEKINQYFLLDMQKQFDIYFKNLFLGVKETSSNFITSNSAVVNTKDLVNIKIDFANPNKWIKKNLPNKITQLMHCCQLSKIEDVKKLLKANVDVNAQKLNDNSTALICSFGNNYNITEKQLEIMEILIPKMSIKALNAKLVKKNETAMSYTIENGLVNIVKLLIDNNVDLNEKCTIDEISYLYYCIQLINKSSLDSTGFEQFNMLQQNRVSSSKEEQTKIINSNPLINNIFDNEISLEFSNMKDNPRHRDIWYKLQKFNHEKYKQNSKNYYKIFDLLVDNLDYVDIREKNGFTPLVFATEINDTYLVKRLLEKGANPDYYTTQNYRAYDYAKFNKNTELMELLT
ncbi:ankyrin repeat domain-containing protein [Aliarcobacter butzleri]|uniref:ankyrin repeat domain-containing protein n=1 Tax=Aliarcobacter butzleri TaxID=28197 RepID=UPI00263E2143|nr:ankyrin repeat domain-containing protein [Aliarcobacter butzleri]MDN5082610.1 ankyrin repeat domain-containing protein [Aliarcobacter butzleri]MDN5084776.1 ankyrin repeat domain-containing protein [Aliarcobacter butzleri]